MYAVQVTSSAVEKVWRLLADEGDFSLKLRAYVTGGGCQGLQYGFAFESEMESDDVELHFFRSGLLVGRFVMGLADGVQALQRAELLPSGRRHQIAVLIDPISFPYLSGAEIDYVMDAHGERFVVRNPNAKTTCGCDRSFTPVD